MSGEAGRGAAPCSQASGGRARGGPFAAGEEGAMSEALFRLRPDQLAGLLGAGARFHRTREAEDRSAAQALRAELAARIPLDGPGSPEAVPATPCGDLGCLRGRTLAEVLLDPGTDAAVLRLLKDHEKALANRAHSDVARSVATVLYYGAIAAALVFRGEKITEHAYGDLARFLGMLVAKTWLPADLREVLVRAREISRLRAAEGAREGA